MSSLSTIGRLAVAVSVACRAAVLPAGDDIVSETVPSPPAETVRFGGAGVRVMVAQRVRPTIDLGTTFDQLVFGRPNIRGRGLMIINGVIVRREQAAAPADTRTRLAPVRNLGEARIAAIDRIRRLSPEQRQRLELALASDIQRLASRIDSVRRKYAGRTISPAAGNIDRDTIVAVRTDAADCRRWISEAFEAGGLLAGLEADLLAPGEADAVSSLLGKQGIVEESP